jgi:hypothetical protein
VGDFARIVLLLLALALVVNLVKYGPAGVGAWFGAKFFGKRYGAVPA